MGKKRNWFSLVKKLFSAKPKPKDGKKSRGWRWVFGGNDKKQYPTLLAPQRTIHEAREEQRKQAMAVAIAMAAAAEAAVAAAHAASEVVHLTGVPQSYQEYEKMTRYSAAVKIQAAYRAHLARKALKALKGLVRLQALVRGRIVRRRVLNKLKCVKCLPPTAMTQPHVVREIRVPTADASCKDKINQQFLSLKEELEEERKKLRCNSGKHWDHSVFSKEDMEAVWLRKQEAAVKRECMKRYSFSHRERRYDRDLETLIPTKENGRLSNQFEQMVDFEPSKRRQTSNLKSTFGSNSVFSDTYRATQFKLKNMHKRDSIEELNSPFSLPRRSFSHTKQKSFGDESSLPNSPNFPTYMATTESAKAKVRSMSTPRQRLGLFDTYTDYNSPYKLRLSTWSTFNGGFSSINGSRRRPEQISLSIKGLH